MKILPQIGLSFDDVLLVPRKGLVSRFNGEIDLSVELTPNIKLKYPIISANMDTVTEVNMANTMYQLGGLGIIHRFLLHSQHALSLAEVEGSRIVCIGVGEQGLDRLLKIKDLVDLDGVLVDVAHGHCDAMLWQIMQIQKFCPNLSIIAGNIATPEAAKILTTAGVDSIKVGVGPGSLCTTRIQTGNGVPQLTAIMNVREILESYKSKPTLIADGGIKNSGDIIKALAAGADAVMIGNLFAGTTEAPGEMVHRDGRPVKKYRGMASKEAQEDWKGQATSVEGESMYLPYKGTVKTIFNNLITGIVSGMSYQGARNLVELRENAVCIQQTQAGYLESNPHGLVRS